MEKSSEPTLIIWSDQYSVKHAEMDGQHRVAIDLINRLFAALKTGEEKSRAGRIMDALADYTVVHFAAEEALLKSAGFGDFSRHKNLHDKMAAKTKQLAEFFDADDEEKVSGLMDLLKKWWTGHILNEDQKYAVLFQA